jgi:hypothetical protein
VARRVHLTGSASKDCDPALLRWAHEALRACLRAHLREGGGLIAQLGGEPYHPDDPSLPLTFDWLIIEAALESLRAGEARPSAEDPLVQLRGSQRGAGQIPPARRDLYDELLKRGAVEVKLLPDTWRSGALIRQAQARIGDVLLTASGGAGAEHLADLYAQRGRPVVPWSIDLGSSGGDGAVGGGFGLAKKALADASDFFRLTSVGAAEARLLGLAVDPAHLRPSADAGGALAGLIADLELPRAFCIRLLNPDVPYFQAVEDHFREVVAPVLHDLGYRVIDLGHERQETAWMNEEIFVQLDRAELVYCDLTGRRSNCFTELGYALGNRQRIVISAHADEQMPFDTDKLPCHFWSPEEAGDARRGALRAHIDQFGTLPPIVAAASLL